MNELEPKWIDRLLGFSLGVVAFVVYVSTLSPCAFPGESSMQMVMHTGLMPRLTPDFPVWHWLFMLVGSLPFGSLVIRLNLISAFFGATAVWLLYHIVSQLIFAAMPVSDQTKARLQVLARFSAVISSLFLAFCVPMWFSANKAHPAAFHLAYLLFAMALFVRWLKKPSASLLGLFAAIYGVGIVEYATFILLAPLVGVIVVVVLWRNEMLSAGNLLPAIVVAPLVALLFYFAAALSFYGTSGFSIRGYDHFFQILWFMWRDQLFLIGQGVSHGGWLIIAVTVVVPWLMMLATARQQLNQNPEWGYLLLHLVLTVVIVGIALNADFSPWALFGGGHSPIMPYVLSASLLGYLVAFWAIIAGWERACVADSKHETIFRRILAALVVLGSLSMVLAQIPRNIKEADGRRAEIVGVVADMVVDSLEGREWLITDGMMDPQILMAARDKGIKVRLVDATSIDNQYYGRYLAGFFSEPRWRNLLELGSFYFLEEWLKTESNVVGKVAMMLPPELWVRAGCVSVPNKLLFLGTKDLRNAAATQLYSQHERFWQEFVSRLGKARCEGAVFESFRNYIFRYASLVANNLGVMLEEEGASYQAFKCYEKARELCPQNISALLNQSAMIDRGFATEEVERVREDLAKLLSDRRSDANMWALARQYGYVRMPEAFTQLGWLWALSGQTGLAATELGKALPLVSGEQQNLIKRALAGIYFAGHELEESENTYREILMEDPDNRAALIGMTRIAARNGKLAEAEQWLEKAEQKGAARALVAVERAVILAARNNFSEATELLWSAVSAQPEMPRGWGLLIWVLSHVGDDNGLERCADRLAGISIPEANYLMSLARGHHALLVNDFKTARAQFEAAMLFTPNNSYVLELILLVDVREKNATLARQDVKRLLRVDPNNTYGNYILGTLQMADGEDELAEVSLRRSLQRGRTMDALNDLAWVLQKQNRLDEAETLSRECVSLPAANSRCWDTLAVILTKKGLYSEAEKAFEKGLAIFQGNYTIYMHMAELYELMGQPQRALELVNFLKSKHVVLPLEDERRFQSLARKLEMTAAPAGGAAVR